MARKGRKQENRSEEKASKRSFLSNFFEPVPEEEGEEFLLFDADDEALDDDFDPYFDEPDALDIDDEGAPRQAAPIKKRSRALFSGADDEPGEEDVDDEGAPRSRRKEKKQKKPKKQKKKKVNPFKAAFDESIPDFDDEIEPEAEPQEEAKPKKRKKRRDKPEADLSADAAEAEEEETLGAPDAAAFDEAGGAEESGEAEADRPKRKRRAKPERIRLFDDEADRLAAEGLTWDDGEKVAPDALFPPDGGDGQADAFADGEPGGEAAEEIILFEDEEEPRKRRRSARTRIFKTGSASAARIQLNETEELLRTEKSRKERREREAREKHRQYVEKQRKKLRRKQSLKKAFGNMAFGGFIVVAVILAMYYTFLLSDIIIVGNQDYSKEYIVEESGLQYGRHMFTVDLDEARANIEENPYLQVDSISYLFPSRVRIEVTERKEVAGIIGLDYNVIIDKNGYVLSMGGGTDLSDLLQVMGVSMTGFQLGQRLGETDDFGTATLISMIGKLEQYQLLDVISAIDLTTPLATTMTAENGLKIHVGQPTELDAKMSSLAILLPQFLRQNISAGALYLSAKGGTVYSSRSTAEILAAGTVTPDDGDGDDAAPNPDADGDGFDDLTGAPYIPATPGPTPLPTPMGGGGDEFQG